MTDVHIFCTSATFELLYITFELYIHQIFSYTSKFFLYNYVLLNIGALFLIFYLGSQVLHRTQFKLSLYYTDYFCINHINWELVDTTDNDK